MELQKGDRIKIFPETNVAAYVSMIHDYGFNCQVVKRKYIEIGEPFKINKEKLRTGRIIYKAMFDKNINVEELSNTIGVSENTIDNWLFGRNTPDKYNRQKLKEILGVEI